jgi:hypothetical protein
MRLASYVPGELIPLKMSCRAADDSPAMTQEGPLVSTGLGEDCEAIVSAMFDGAESLTGSSKWKKRRLSLVATTKRQNDHARMEGGAHTHWRKRKLARDR